MSRAQMLRVFVNQRLNAAVEEIFGLFEKTIQGYEEEIDRQRRLLENVLKPEVQINKPALPQLFVHQVENPPEQQEWSPSLDQEPRHIKEEQEELWTSQEEEQLQGSEEADIIKFPFTPVPVKSENDEEKPQSSQLNQSQTDQSREAELPGCTSTEQMKTEPDGEDCGASESASNLDPASDVQPTNDGQLLSSDCSEIESEDINGDWKETGEAQSDLNTLKNNNILGSHMRSHIGEKPIICTVCGENFSLEEELTRHMIVHSEKKPFNCPFCGKGFHKKAPMQVHVRSHTGERPFSCSVCGKGFVCKVILQRHMTSHTGEKPFDCSVCGKRFGLKCNLTTHMRLHTGEKPFSCSVCGRRFVQKCNLNAHMRFHTGEKPYGCSGCGKKFSRLSHVKSHKCGNEAAAGETVSGAEQSCWLR
ncbi:uncharacterized protein LOC139928850 [Centroberyx gerrardi]|uniref:uncharacterized protein n=1 Tax=Centroberyx gerrardi TaxID=166262 RepID=UPI003AAA8CA2